MANSIEEIRELIRKDQIENALKMALAIASEESLMSINLLSNRYERVKRAKRLGIGDNIVEYNHIIIGLLETLNELEGRSL